MREMWPSVHQCYQQTWVLHAHWEMGKLGDRSKCKNLEPRIDSLKLTLGLQGKKVEWLFYWTCCKSQVYEGPAGGFSLCPRRWAFGSSDSFISVLLSFDVTFSAVKHMRRVRPTSFADRPSSLNEQRDRKNDREVRSFRCQLSVSLRRVLPQASLATSGLHDSLPLSLNSVQLQVSEVIFAAA
eukprot:763020-Hanusia_phi.AAC.3